MADMTFEEHQERHVLLHRHLDELMADMITHTKMFPSKTTVMEMASWSAKQAKKPTGEHVPPDKNRFEKIRRKA